jgi:hypothetical protein
MVILAKDERCGGHLIEFLFGILYPVLQRIITNMNSAKNMKVNVRVISIAQKMNEHLQ